MDGQRINGYSADMRISDLNQLDDQTTIEADLCIVGSGPAGVSIANEFANTDVDVLLLESGGIDEEADTQSLYEIDNVGAHRILDQNNLRRRVLGGSSHVWTGRCAPLDAIDFEARPWIPNSGWPIGQQDLDPYWERAGKNLNLGPQVYDSSLWPLLNGKHRFTAFNASCPRTAFLAIQQKCHL